MVALAERHGGLDSARPASTYREPGRGSARRHMQFVCGVEPEAIDGWRRERTLFSCSSFAPRRCCRRARPRAKPTAPSARDLKLSADASDLWQKI